MLRIRDSAFLDVTVREMEAADWVSLGDEDKLELKAAADSLMTADETADHGFQILDQMEGDGSAKAR